MFGPINPVVQNGIDWEEQCVPL